MPLPLYVIDAFSAAPFAGNPAAVCLLDRPRDDGWMQQVASEMNLSETAFPVPAGDHWHLRWFTPAVEVALCGHATLATAHALWQTGRAGPDEAVRFHTKSGLLTARREGAWIELDFPALPSRPCEPPPGLAEALGADLVTVGNYGMDYLCEVAGEEALRRLRPDMARLASLKTRGVTVTSRPAAGAAYDFVSRFFAPGAGVAEDPVTGSAHCALAPYWAPRLGKDEMVGHQASRRGGVVRVRLRGDRVLLGGQAMTVLRGEIEA
jgi:PhzF family phenazine biosynthesis protein